MSDDGGKRTEDPGAMMESDEEDEDYVPGVDPDERVDDDDDENDAAVGVGADADDAATRPALSITKRRAADDAFLELFGYPYAPTPPARDGPSTDGKSRDKLPAGSRKRRVADVRARSILSTIFGRNAARKLVSRAKFAAAFGRPKAGGGGMVRLERRVVVEVKRFAGQEIRVEKVVMVPVMAGEGKTVARKAADGTASGESTAAAAVVGGGGARGVDDLLDEMSRPEKLSTVAKTSADWDLFKSKNADAALKEQLESKARGNEAYLVKKDFLGRVDERRFELERRERDRERAKRGK